MFPSFPVDSVDTHSAIAVGLAEFGSVTAFSHNPTPIAWEVIISSCAGNHCEKSRDDSVYKPMTTDGDFLQRFLSINKQNKNPTPYFQTK